MSRPAGTTTLSATDCGVDAESIGHVVEQTRRRVGRAGDESDVRDARSEAGSSPSFVE